MNESIRSAVSLLDAPFSVLNLDAALANAQDMTRRAAGTPIRLASKSIRIRPLISHVLALPGFHGVLSYNINEAIWLAETRVSKDILVAYPTVDTRALKQLLSDTRLLKSITLMVDSPAHLELIESIRSDNQNVRICIDIDAALSFGPVHIGALRSPIHSVDQVRSFVSTALRKTNFHVVGVMAYEGQIAGTADTSPVVAVMKKLSERELAERRQHIINAVEDELSAAGRPRLEFVNGGGTGSIETTGSEQAITEIGAGSGVIGPGLFDSYKNFSPTPAQWFVLPVVRHPANDIVTVAGGGRIASGPVGKDRLPKVDYPPGLKMSALEGAGEVQTPLKGKAANRLRLGDHVWMRHSKAGEQTEWTNYVHVMSGGEIIDRWPTYRGEGKCFV